ncbi:hypothetical protein ACFL0M_12990 [Thermodesulfobacteriota bacterium]
MMPEISQDYWENFVAIIVAFAVLALIIERALYQIFDSKLWKKVERTLDQQVGGDYMDFKPWISVLDLNSFLSILMNGLLSPFSCRYCWTQFRMPRLPRKPKRRWKSN